MKKVRSNSLKKDLPKEIPIESAEAMQLLVDFISRNKETINCSYILSVFDNKTDEFGTDPVVSVFRTAGVSNDEDEDEKLAEEYVKNAIETTILRLMQILEKEFNVPQKELLMLFGPKEKKSESFYKAELQKMLN